MECVDNLSHAFQKSTVDDQNVELRNVYRNHNLNKLKLYPSTSLNTLSTSLFASSRLFSTEFRPCAAFTA
jgi:hypothetical protein